MGWVLSHCECHLALLTTPANSRRSRTLTTRTPELVIHHGICQPSRSRLRTSIASYALWEQATLSSGSTFRLGPSRSAGTCSFCRTRCGWRRTQVQLTVNIHPLLTIHIQSARRQAHGRQMGPSLIVHHSSPAREQIDPASYAANRRSWAVTDWCVDHRPRLVRYGCS